VTKSKRLFLFLLLTVTLLLSLKHTWLLETRTWWAALDNDVQQISGAIALNSGEFPALSVHPSFFTKLLFGRFVKMAYIVGVIPHFDVSYFSDSNNLIMQWPYIIKLASYYSLICSIFFIMCIFVLFGLLFKSRTIAASASLMVMGGIGVCDQMQIIRSELLSCSFGVISWIFILCATQQLKKERLFRYLICLFLSGFLYCWALYNKIMAYPFLAPLGFEVFRIVISSEYNENYIKIFGKLGVYLKGKVLVLKSVVPTTVLAFGFCVSFFTPYLITYPLIGKARAWYYQKLLSTLILNPIGTTKVKVSLDLGEMLVTLNYYIEQYFSHWSVFVVFTLLFLFARRKHLVKKSLVYGFFITYLAFFCIRGHNMVYLIYSDWLFVLSLCCILEDLFERFQSEKEKRFIALALVILFNVYHFRYSDYGDINKRFLRADISKSKGYAKMWFSSPHPYWFNRKYIMAYYKHYGFRISPEKSHQMLEGMFSSGIFHSKTLGEVGRH
jgi:hypothetical protein